MIRRLALSTLALATACSVFTDLDGFSTPGAAVVPADAATGAAAADAAPVVTCAPGQDFTADPKNCGRCGHDCLGGACLQNACQPVLLTTGATSFHVRADATHLYFADTAKHVISRVPKRGGPIEVLADDEPFLYELEIDDQHVYYQTAEHVRRVPKQGGPRQDLAPATNIGFVAIDAKGLFWAEGQGVGGARIHQAGADGSGEHVIVKDRSGVETIEIDGDQMYYGENGLDRAAGGVRVYDLVTGQDKVVAEHPCRRLVLDRDNVYFLDYLGPSVWRAPRAGGPAIGIGTGPYVTYDADLAVDDTYVYWAAGGSTGGGLYRVEKKGGDTVTLASMNDVAGVAIDEAAVYWTIRNQPQVYLLAK